VKSIHSTGDNFDRRTSNHWPSEMGKDSISHVIESTVMMKNIDLEILRDLRVLNLLRIRKPDC
jgi:hypothetical protein